MFRVEKIKNRFYVVYNDDAERLCWSKDRKVARKMTHKLNQMNPARFLYEGLKPFSLDKKIT